MRTAHGFVVRLRWFILGLVFLWTVGGARAQSRQFMLEASARAFFKQGIALSDAGQYAQAADRFRRALVIRESPVIMYNLASVLETIGKVMEALELLYGVEEHPDADADLRRDARAMRAGLEAKLAFASITIPRTLRGRVHVWVDDFPLIDAQLGVPIPLDPGWHHVQMHDGREPAAVCDFEVASGAQARVALRAAGSLLSAAEVARAYRRRHPGKDVPGSRLVRNPWFWAGVGAGVVGLVVLASALTLSGHNGSTVPLAP